MKYTINISISGVSILAIAFLFHCAWFSFYTYSNSLPGNGDIFYNLAAYEWAWNYFSWGNESYTFCYPTNQVKWLLGTDIWLWVVYVPLKALIAEPVLRVNLFMSLIMTMNSAGIYLILKSFISQKVWLFLFSVLMVYMPFFYGTLDNPNSIFFLPASAMINFSFMFLESGNSKLIWKMFLCAALQFYFNAYFGVFSFLYLVVLFIYNRNQTIKNANSIAFSSLIALALLYPFINNFLINKSLEGVNQISMHFANHVLSHNFQTLTTYPTSTLFSEIFSKDNSPTANYNVFPGFAVSLMIMYFVFFSTMKHKRLILFFFTGFLLLSLGYFIEVGAYNIPLPLGILDYFFPIHNFIRVPTKAYIFAGLFLIIIISSSLYDMFNKRLNHLNTLLFSICLIVEQFPIFPKVYHNGSDLIPPSTLSVHKEIFSAKNVFFYPSTIFYPPAEADFRFDRGEYLYMLWAADFNANLVNGLTSARIPSARVKLNTTLLTNKTDSILKILDDYQIDYLILMDKFVINEHQRNIQKMLIDYYKPQLLFESEGTKIYRLKKFSGELSLNWYTPN